MPLAPDRIESVEALHLRLERVEGKADGTQEVLVVRIATEAGRVGHGEAVSCSHVAKAIIEAPRAAPFRWGLAAAILGRDAVDPAARFADMLEHSRWYGRRGAAMHAIAAIDTALWDIVGQAREMPCHAVWGTRRERVRAYASVLFPDAPADGAALARQAVAAGFGAVKFGWNRFGRDPAWDDAMLAAIRGGLGDAELMIDAGRVWDSETALARAPGLFADFRPTWLEEPLNEDDLAGYAALARLPGVRIATGETEETLGHFEALLEAGVQVVQPDIGRAAGPSVCLKVAEAAHRRGRWCVPHCFGTGVNLMASLHWALAMPEAPFLEWPLTASPLRNDLVRGLPAMRDGHVPAPDRPGLGITLDEATIARYRVL